MMVHKNAAAKPIRTKRRKAEPVTVTKVNPHAMALALKLAGNDATRIKPVDGNTVLVVNHA